ncbi:outer membrane lipid asymmetry maintenance protein MlaD [Rhodovibrio salinarum]|uniref:Outer membrane lipid asymmetry maintenance protein MlaD n=1 Tax=Rhodovibrio salinarum TaxID=1087 RepID=A0A934UYW2_9PROT|nr:outer membrane lipid asymmetry maintenance protein MlaD [Rhodovibrio salinarum]MBK1695879.1 outer membrane lipid asymmetry maintenance protein MlaD [Rhodovibrio salinarum]
MRRNIIETIMGAAVILVAVGFVVFAFSATGVGSSVDGYRVTARFDNAQGVTPGTDVRMAGVKIGAVVAQRLNTETYFAEVELAIQEDIRLPQDTSARIVPEGLLGGNYVNLEPGGAEATIPDGGQIQYTQGAVNLIDLIGRFMFSSGGDSGGSGSGGSGSVPGGGAVPGGN